MAPRLLAKFVPGAGIAISLYQGLTFVLNNQQQMGDFFQGLLDGMDNLVGSLTNPNRLTAFTNGLVSTIENRTCRALLDFAAAQLGLGNLRQDIQKVIQFIPNQVDAAMRRMVSSIAASLVPSNAGGLYAGQMTPAPAAFTYNNQNYTLWVAKDRTGVKVKVASGGTLLGVLTAASFDNTVVANASAHLTALITAAHEFRRGRQRQTRQCGGHGTASCRDHGTRSGSRRHPGQRLHGPQRRLLRGKNETVDSTGLPQGGEHSTRGIGLRPRNESHPNGPTEAKLVEEKFDAHPGAVLHLHLPEGQLVRTTPEHPFYVYEKGWTAAGMLQTGEQIRTEEGWTTVEDVYDTEDYEKVYNLRVAEHHTYFVGDADWGFALWRHNDYTA